MLSSSVPALPPALDPYLDENLPDPYPLYAELRDMGPALYSSDRNMWFATRYDSVSEVLRNYRSFISGLGTSYVRLADTGFKAPFVSPFTDLDNPEHTRVRRSVQQRFSKKAVEEMRPDIRADVAQLAAGPLSDGIVDVVKSLTRLLPDRMVRHLTGIASPDIETAAAWAEAVLHGLGPDVAPRFTELAFQSLEWLSNEGSAALPAHCLGRDILERGGDGGGLREGNERLWTLATIWWGAVDTTNALLSNMINAFALHPEQWDLLRANPELVANAVEEAARWDSPNRTIIRRTSEDVDLCGVTIPADSNVCVLIPSANRDPLAFENADQFDISAARKNGSVAFGASIHMCLGRPFATLEATELLRHLVDRVVRLEFAGEPERLASRVIRTFRSLPIRFVTD